jgi:uncharacterized protein (DUF2147 family)
MKKSILLSVFLLFALIAKAQTKADDLLGVWLSEDKDGKITVFKENGKYYGRITWGKDGTRTDTKNPDEKLRSRKIVGSVILKDFTFDGDDTWEDGTIYDPNSGKTYDCKMTLQGANTLNIRGFVGISMFGRTSVWTRTK